MQFDALTEMMGGLMPYGLVCFLGLILAVLGAVMVASGRKVNPGLIAAGSGLAALAGAISAGWAIPSDAAAEGSFDAVRLATTIRFAAWFGMSAVGGMALLVLAVGGAKGSPRDVKAAGAGGAAVLLVVLLTAASGFMNGESGAGIFFYARAVEYALMGSLVAVAMLSGGAPDEPGREAGAAAALTFALMVAVCESAGRAATTFFLLIAAGNVEIADRATVIEGYLALTGTEIPWMFATIAAACLVAVVGVANAARDGNHGAWAALVWLIVVPAVWLGGDASTELLVAVSNTLP